MSNFYNSIYIYIYYIGYACLDASSRFPLFFGKVSSRPVLSVPGSNDRPRDNSKLKLIRDLRGTRYALAIVALPAPLRFLRRGFVLPSLPPSPPRKFARFVDRWKRNIYIYVCVYSQQSYLPTVEKKVIIKRRKECFDDKYAMIILWLVKIAWFMTNKIRNIFNMYMYIEL